MILAVLRIVKKMLDRLSIIRYTAPMKKLKRPRDLNQLASNIVALATGEVSEPPFDYNKNPRAIELGRLGGLKGGKARAKVLSKARRKQIATKAANARWKNNKTRKLQ
ncbi:MAG: histone H1 [Candidatus Zixiibacteriota bacterium]